MRKGTSREITLFSLSFLDLFASALGAFILITLLLIPYYAKSTASNAEISDDTIKKAMEFAILGISTSANRFVVLIDMSGSMEDYTELMSSTVDRLIQPMDDSKSLQLIGFQGKTLAPKLHLWQTKPELVAMSDENKTSAKRFVRGIIQRFGEGTPTMPSLKNALAYDADAVILITDGEPNSATDTVVKAVTQANLNQRQIHSIALGDYRKKPELVTFLEQLAKANNGGFLAVTH